MDLGTEFLKSQVTEALTQHRAFLTALQEHEEDADDSRFRDLCSRHMPRVRDDERMLEEYQSQLVGDAAVEREVIGGAVGISRELADAARGSDYNRLARDIAMARQLEDTFKTFREAGKMMGNRTLHEIGEIGERHHDAYGSEANRLIQHLFVERAQGLDRRTREGVEARLGKSN